MPHRIRHRPPRLAAWLLEKMVAPPIRTALLGDFEEYYRTLAQRSGAFAAYRWYWLQILRSAPAFTLDLIHWTGTD